jgi:hypothetical protein
MDEADGEEELEHGILLRDEVPDHVHDLLRVDAHLVVQRVHVGRRLRSRCGRRWRQGGGGGGGCRRILVVHKRFHALCRICHRLLLHMFTHRL